MTPFFAQRGNLSKTSARTFTTSLILIFALFAMSGSVTDATAATSPDAALLQSQANRGQIQGIVTEEGTNDVLPGANVRVTGTNDVNQAVETGVAAGTDGRVRRSRPVRLRVLSSSNARGSWRERHDMPGRN